MRKLSLPISSKLLKEMKFFANFCLVVLYSYVNSDLTGWNRGWNNIDQHVARRMANLPRDSDLKSAPSKGRF